MTSRLLSFATFFMIWTSFSSVTSAQYDPQPAWPLCGNYYLTAPASWNPITDGCPSSRFGTGYEDLINDSYGPRYLAGAYDWHRGIDLHTDGEDGRPVFAITCGKVVEVDPTYNGLVVIQHYPGETCTDQDEPSYPMCSMMSGTCYYSRYRHLSSAAVVVGDTVAKGQYIGETGRNASSPDDNAYPHLHFELRQPPGGHDPIGRGQRDAIHPLQVLAYDNSSGASNMSLSLAVSGLVTKPVATVTVSIPNTAPTSGSSGSLFRQLDLEKIAVVVYEKRGGGLFEIPQPNLGASYTTPEGTPYQVHPPHLAMETHNRQYQYKDSFFLPYGSFLPAGIWLSPYADSASSVYDSSFPGIYQEDYHLELASSSDPSLGEFNGMEIYAADFNRTKSSYDVAVTFKKLVGVSSLRDDLCIKAYARDALGKRSATVSWGACGGLIVP